MYALFILIVHYLLFLPTNALIYTYIFIYTYIYTYIHTHIYIYI